MIGVPAMFSQYAAKSEWLKTKQEKHPKKTIKKQSTIKQNIPKQIEKT